MVDYFLGIEEPAGIRAMAHDLGMRYIEGNLDRQFDIDVPEGLPMLPLFNNGSRSQISEMCYGSFAGLTTKVFTFDAVGYTEDPTHPRRTCALFTMPSNFASITIGPHSRLSRVQERGGTPFASRYRVHSRDADMAGLMLDEPMQRYLMGLDETLRVEISGRALLGHTPLVEPSQIPVLIQQMYGLYLKIPDGAWARYGVDMTI